MSKAKTTLLIKWKKWEKWEIVITTTIRSDGGVGLWKLISSACRVDQVGALVPEGKKKAARLSLCTEYTHFCFFFYNSQPYSYYILLPVFLRPQKSIVCENRQMAPPYEWRGTIRAETGETMAQLPLETQMIMIKRTERYCVMDYAWWKIEMRQMDFFYFK